MLGRVLRVSVAVVIVVAVAPPAARATPRVALPPAAGKADYQLGGAYPPPAGTRIVERDRTARPAAGAYGICYLNGFQTQPDAARWWMSRHPNLLLRDAAGRPVRDPGWPDEMLLDTSSAAKRSAIAAIEYRWIDGCASSGFAAIEADNLDSWTRSKGRLRPAHNVALARLLNVRAHHDGLASGQKNAPELAGQGRRLGFDFAVAEECAVYDECSSYTHAYGGRVLEVEYTDNGQAAYDSSCRTAAGTRSILLRDRQLTTPDSADYRYRAC